MHPEDTSFEGGRMFGIYRNTENSLYFTCNRFKNYTNLLVLSENEIRLHL